MKNKKIISIVLSVILLLSSFLGVNAQTSDVYVSQNGSGTLCTVVSPCSALVGMATVQDGGVIYVIGVLTNPLRITKNISLIGYGEGAGIDATGKNQTGNDNATLMLSASGRMEVANLFITGGFEWGIRNNQGKAHGSYLHDLVVRDNVWENRSGDACLAGENGSWGSPIRLIQTSNILIERVTVYNGCGEGIGVIGVNRLVIRDSYIYDNYSVNIDIDNGTKNALIENNRITCINPNFQRKNSPFSLSAPISINAESYSGLTINQVENVKVVNNIITGCRGISSYTEVSGGFKDITIQNNTGVNIKGNFIPSNIAGVNIVLSPNAVLNTTPTIGTAFITPTRTATIPVSRTPTRTATAILATPSPNGCFGDAVLLLCYWIK